MTLSAYCVLERSARRLDPATIAARLLEDPPQTSGQPSCSKLHFHLCWSAYTFSFEVSENLDTLREEYRPIHMLRNNRSPRDTQTWSMNRVQEYLVLLMKVDVDFVPLKCERPKQRRRA